MQAFTGVARNFDWREPKMKKHCDVILVTSIGWRNGDDVTKMTS